MEWAKLCWKIVKSPKNLTIFVLSIFVLLLGFGTYHYHGKVISIQNEQLKQTVQKQEKNQEANKKLDAQYQQGKKELDQSIQQTKQLGVKGTCHEKNYYDRANAIVGRFNKLP